MADPRELTPEAIEDIASQHVAGISTRDLARQYHTAHTTMARILQRPALVQAIDAIPAAVAAVEVERDDAVQREKTRADATERKSRQRDRDKRDAAGAPQTPHSARRDGKPSISEQKHTSYGDGRILGWARAGHDGSFSYTKASGGSLEGESYEAWLVRRAKERDEEAALPSTDIPILWDTGSTSYDYLDLEDVRRAATWIEEVVGYPATERNELIERLVDARHPIDLRTETLAAEAQAA